MSWKRFVPLLLSGVVVFLIAYVAAAPPGAVVSWAQNCCVFPTLERESAAGTGSGLYATVAAFQMTLSDSQGTDFTTNGSSSSGMVGEYNFATGEDTCYGQAKNSSSPPPANWNTTGVIYPEPTYYWYVGQVGYCSIGYLPCPPGATNTVDPKLAYNQFGYDGVGYRTDQVTYYRYFVPNISIPCGYELYQGMANYCILTNCWAPYASNVLTAQISWTYVTDCKDSVCATIEQ